jgi:uncharacterized protein GlcG (DUF336 family)
VHMISKALLRLLILCWVANACAAPAKQRQPPSKQEQQTSSCPTGSDALTVSLQKSVAASGGPSNGGFDNNEWAVVVDREGTICAIAFSGARWQDQWLGSRNIAVAKANTALEFSLDDKAISTANLYAGAQPGGYLYGLPVSNPSPPAPADTRNASKFGGDGDPLNGRRAGGVIVFGGGLALYDANGLAGGLGVSGDTSCADHNVAWRVRHELNLDHVKAGPSPKVKDGIIYDIGLNGRSVSGFGHPKCLGGETAVALDIGAGEGGSVLP